LVPSVTVMACVKCRLMKVYDHTPVLVVVDVPMPQRCDPQLDMVSATTVAILVGVTKQDGQFLELHEAVATLKVWVAEVSATM